MKKLLVLLITSLAFMSLDAAAAAQKKEVCKIVKGKKVCKIIKIHKKIDNATKVPEPIKKAKKPVAKKKK